MRNFKKFAIFSLAGLFLIALPFGAFAGSEQFNKAVYVGPDEIIDGNFIKVGATIDIAGAVNGDVIVAGSSITISGSVAGDVIAAGNSVKIKGPVGGSIRVVGSTIEISSVVERNVWALGSAVAINKESNISWDVFAAGANVELRGPVSGNIWTAGANVIIAGQVGKDATVSLDKEGQLVLYPEAKISGNLNYKAFSEEQLIFQEGAEVIGEVVRKDITKKSDFDFSNIFGATYLFFKLISFFSLLLIGIVLVSLAPKIVLRVEEEMTKRPWPSLGWGFVFLIITPVVCLLLALTIIGIPLVFIIMPIYLISLYISKVFAGFAIGLLILNGLNKDKKFMGSLIWPLVLGLLVFVALNIIPIIGFLASILLTLWAFGALINVKREIWREYR